MDESFGKSEKLKSKILIQRLFKEGISLKKYPLRLIYLPLSETENAHNKTGFSVPKRNHKRAVDRIKLKRVMREAFRKNKYLVINDICASFAIMFIYTGREELPYSKIFPVMEELLKRMRLKEKERCHEKESK